jgi:predicted dehydrogenase
MDAKMPAHAVALGQLYRWKASREVPDTLNAVLEYPEGFAVNLSSTFNNQLSAEGGFHILGTEGSIVLGWTGLTYYPENAIEDNRWIVESWPRRLEEQYWRDPKVIASELEPKKRPRREPEKISTPGPEATVAHFGHFFDSIRTRKPYWEDAAAGHRAAACAHMVNQAAKEKRMVSWDFQRDDIRA